MFSNLFASRVRYAYSAASGSRVFLSSNHAYQGTKAWSYGRGDLESEMCELPARDAMFMAKRLLTELL